MKGKNIGAQGGNTDSYWVITRASAVSGNDLRSADAGRDENGRPDVKFTLTGEGGRRFYAFTSAHVGDRLAVVLDNKVMEVATIQEAIRDEGRITGAFTEQQTQDLSLTLRSGALPAGIKYLEERTVGPSLGADSIRAGVRAAIFGMLAVMAFMLFYYKFAGINADLGLFLNLVILLGFPRLHGRDADTAGHRWSHPDDRYGRGFERADLRAHSRRAAPWQDAAAGGGAGLQACLGHDR